MHKKITKVSIFLPFFQTIIDDGEETDGVKTYLIFLQKSINILVTMENWDSLKLEEHSESSETSKMEHLQK